MESFAINVCDAHDDASLQSTLAIVTPSNLFTLVTAIRAMIRFGVFWNMMPDSLKLS